MKKAAANAAAKPPRSRMVFNHSGRLAGPAGRGGSADFARQTTILFTKKHVGEKNEYETNLWVVPAEGPRGNASPEARQFTSGKHRLAQPAGPPMAGGLPSSPARDKPKSQIYLIAAGGGEATPLTRFPEGTIKAFKWSPDGRLLAVAFRETDADRTKEAEKAREASGAHKPPYVIDDFFYRYDGDGYFGGLRFHLYVVDVATGEHRLLRREPRAGSFNLIGPRTRPSWCWR